MLDFLDLFADIVLYPMSIDVNSLENPLTIISVASLLGIGFVVLVRRLFWRI